MAQDSKSSEDIALNLSAIVKTDKFGCEVLDKCTSSALYKYVQGKWEKSNCDGVFLLYRRTVAPQYAFMLLNKRSTQNHVQQITKAMGLQLQPPFLLYRTESGEIHGMWFYTQRDCQRIAASVGQLVVSLGGDSLRLVEDRAAAAAKGKAGAAVSSAKQQQQQQQQQPSSGQSANADAANSILQMLSRAQTDFKHRGLPQPPPQQLQQQQQPKVISLDSLFGGASKQQQQQQPPSTVSSTLASVPNGGVGGPPLPRQQRDQYAEMSHQIKEQLGLVTGLQKLQQPQQHPRQPQPQQQQQQPTRSSEASCSAADEEEEEFLLTPGMLEGAASQLMADCPQEQQTPTSPPQLQRQQSREQQKQQAHVSSSGDIPALTKEQLRESLFYLLENDDAFLSSLHRAYVASLQRRLASHRI